MNKMLFAAIGLVIALAVACSGDTPGPTATPTIVPIATAAPQTPAETPMPVREWNLEEISVDGSTVTVSLRVFAGIDVGVTINGKEPTRVEAVIPVINFVFEGVPIGEHSVVVSDVVGHKETASVTVEAPPSVDAMLPIWLADWVEDLEARNVEFPPRSIIRYQWQGATVYHVVKQCCDQFSDLLDADGNLIGHPDGGITGRGDGVTVFSPVGLKGNEVWVGR
jgi:hypothetical protein